MPDLRAAFNAARLKYKDAEHARDQKKKVDDLKKELAWSYVHDKERQLRLHVDDVAKQERRLPKVESEVQKAKVTINSVLLLLAQESAREFLTRHRLQCLRRRRYTKA